MAKKTKTPAVAVPESDVEVIAKPGLGIEEGLILTTTFLLALAITLVITATGAYN